MAVAPSSSSMTAIEDSYHTLAIDPRLVVECNAIAGCFNGEDFVKPL